MKKHYNPIGSIMLPLLFIFAFLLCWCGAMAHAQTYGGAGGSVLHNATVYSVHGSYTWTKPANVGYVSALLIGAGGGGGGASNLNTSSFVEHGGGGGGAGSCTQITRFSVTSNLTITVGQGGAGGTTAAIPSNGGKGGTTSVAMGSVYYIAPGGSGGSAGTGSLGGGGGISAFNYNLGTNAGGAGVSNATPNNGSNGTYLANSASLPYLFMTGGGGGGGNGSNTGASTYTGGVGGGLWCAAGGSGGTNATSTAAAGTAYLPDLTISGGSTYLSQGGLGAYCGGAATSGSNGAGGGGGGGCYSTNTVYNGAAGGDGYVVLWYDQ